MKVPCWLMEKKLFQVVVLCVEQELMCSFRGKSLFVEDSYNNPCSLVLVSCS